MPSQSAFDTGRRLLVAAGTAHFSKLQDLDLLGVPEELDRIATAFATLGYERLSGAIDPDRDTLRKLYSDVKKGCADGDVLVAYYTAHGVKDEDRYYLLTHESDLSDLDETALPAEDLARALTKGTKAAQVLVILDACYAGGGASEFAQVASRLKVALGGTGGAVIFVLAAARPKQEAEQGALSIALAQALANNRFGDRLQLQPYFFLDQVLGEIRRYLELNHPSQVASWDITNYYEPCRIFPNPRYQPEIRSGLDVESNRAFTEHWVPKARGAELGVGGWYFTGREQALRELAAWLGQDDSGSQPRVVTGGPGCGKSAVLARVVTLADPNFRRDVLATSEQVSLDPETLPPEGVVNVAVHARHKLLADVVAQIADALNLNARHPAELIAGLVNRRAKTVIVVDGLDEADEKDLIVSGLLGLLLGLPWVFLLIGTRPDSTGKGQRFRALGKSTVEIDLDASRYICVDDVAQYVERRLLATEEPKRWTPYREAHEVAVLVARAVAGRANNVFLVAHAAVQALLARRTAVDVADPAWIDRLPTDIDDAFDRALAELGQRKPEGLSAATARSVLTALAFAKGEGLPWGELWGAVATSIAGSHVSDTDIHLVGEHTAGFIIESLENERSVYRLYHERIAEHLRDSVNAAETERRIVAALRSTVPFLSESRAPDWVRAHPYIKSHLLSHALELGVARELVEDGAFIAAAEPLRTLQALSQMSDTFSRRVSAAYTLGFAILSDCREEDRLSYLEMVARQLGDDALADILSRGALSRRWSVPWAHWMLLTAHRTISASSQRISCIALGNLDGRSVIVSGGMDGRLMVWDLASGVPLGNPLRGHQWWIHSVALGTLDGHPIIVSGGEDETVRLWDLASGTPLGEPLRGHEGDVFSVALGTLDGHPIIVSGGEDETVRLWDLASGAPLGEPLRGHEGRVFSVAVGTLDSHPIIVSGGEDKTVRLWDLASGAPLGEPLRGHEGRVFSVALGTVDGHPVIVSGGDDGRLYQWYLAWGKVYSEQGGYVNSVVLGAIDQGGYVNSVVLGAIDGRPVIISGLKDGTVRVSTLNGVTSTALGEPLRGHDGEVFSVAVGTLDSHPIIVSGGRDGTVRVWDLASRMPRGAPSGGHKGFVWSVALGAVDDRPVIVSGGQDSTVRVWYLGARSPRGPALRGHEGDVWSVALGTLYDHPVIVSGGEDGTVRVWDPASATQRCGPFRVHEGHPVHAVALGTLDNLPIIVSGGGDGTVRVSDLASGAPLWEPLRGHKGHVFSAAPGTLGGRPVIVSGGGDGTVRLWDLSSGVPLGEPLRGHEGRVFSVALGMLAGCPVIISGADDGTVWLWDLSSGTPLGEQLYRHGYGGVWVALGMSDGRPVIVSGGEDGTVRVSDRRNGDSTTVPVGSVITDLACSETGIAIVSGHGGLLAFQLGSKIAQ